MNKKIYGILGVIIIISIFSALYFYPKTQVIKEGFENGFGGWVADSNVPLEKTKCILKEDL